MSVKVSEEHQCESQEKLGMGVRREYQQTVTLELVLEENIRVNIKGEHQSERYRSMPV